MTTLHIKSIKFCVATLNHNNVEHYLNFAIGIGFFRFYRDKKLIEFAFVTTLITN